MLQIPLEWFEFSFKCLLTLGLTYVYKATISVTSPHITSTHYKRSDFQEWILGSKVCRCSCQQCCYILHSHRGLYPADIHWYLEETYLLCKTLLDVQPHSHIAYGIMRLYHHSLCEIQVNLIVCHSINIECTVHVPCNSNLCSWIHLPHSHCYKCSCNFQWYQCIWHFHHSHWACLMHIH